MSDLYRDLSDAVTAGNTETTKKLVNQALAERTGAQTVLERGLLPGMHVVGERFRSGEMFVPEVLFAARAMRAGMEILRPLLTETGGEATGTVVIGTVQGDHHSIGKNLVAMMLEGAGYRVVDLGIDVTPQTFVQAVSEHKPDIVAMSALLTTTMLRMAETVNALKDAGMRDCVKIMAGGAPVTDEFVKNIGGDGYASNAGAAVDKAKELLGR
ncbi:MAG: corrinoid protein [Acidobacteria bacterium]|nr:corrinoid protein [Acidobacteriota bacterium]